MNLEEKLEQIHNIIKEIGAEDPGAGNILLEGFGLSLNVLKAVAEKGDRDIIDVSEHLEIVTRLLGFDLEDLVRFIIETEIVPARQQQMSSPNFQGQPVSSNKEADNELLNFITDGEQENVEAKEVFDNINFLNSIIDGTMGNPNNQTMQNIPPDPTLKVGPTGQPIINGTENSTITPASQTTQNVSAVQEPSEKIDQSYVDDYEKFLATVKAEKEIK